MNTEPCRRCYSEGASLPFLTLELDTEDMNRLIAASERSGYTLGTFMKILLAYSLSEFEHYDNFSFASELARNISEASEGKGRTDPEPG